MQDQLPLLQKQAAQLFDGVEVGAACLVSADAQTTSCMCSAVPSACYIQFVTTGSPPHMRACICLLFPHAKALDCGKLYTRPISWLLCVTGS